MAVSNDPKHMFGAPVPGASLTSTPNSAPWQQAPQFTDLHKALVYTWDTLFKDPDTVMKLMAFLRSGMTITEIVNVLLFSGIAGSKWNVDIALLMYQTVCHQLEVIAHTWKVKYTFKRIQPSTASFVKQFNQYLSNPDDKEQKIEQVVQKPLFASLED